MTDEEILRRLAEIEGWTDCGTHTVSLYEGHKALEGLWIKELGKVWNPLTNWSDLGPLIEKYRVWIKHDEMGSWGAIEGYEPIEVFNESLPHAICLAIIEAHE